jgi:general secretion pathway protein G
MKLMRKARERGFTLIEMVIVIVIMGVLLAIALPMYNNSITRAKEARLHQNLKVLNEVIQQYSYDKKVAPQSLQDLVDANYLKFVPDDITGNNTSWQLEQEDPQNCWNADQCGIGGVHSGSDEMASDGSGAYSSWKK